MAVYIPNALLDNLSFKRNLGTGKLSEELKNIDYEEKFCTQASYNFSLPFPLQDVKPWAIHLISQRLGFIICKI